VDPGQWHPHSSGTCDAPCVEVGQLAGEPSIEPSCTSPVRCRRDPRRRPPAATDFPDAFVPLVTASNAALEQDVRFFDGSNHGYLRCDLDRSSWRTQVRVVASILVAESPVRTLSTWAVEAGQPGAVPA
jgi:hypothetical protein